MDKFGVDEESDANKLASDQTTCPACGRALRPVTETGVLLCPTCGSKPFERKEAR